MNKRIGTLVLCLAGAMGAQAVSIDWDAGGGADKEWSNTNNWENYNNDPLGVQIVPGNSNTIDRADFFAVGDSATVTTPVTSPNKVDIMARNNGNITISADMPDLRVIQIGINGGTAGFGTFIKQDAGTVTARDLTLGTDDTNGGLYELSGSGALTLTGATKIGANGKISMIGSGTSLAAGNGAGDNFTMLTTGILDFQLDADGVGTIDVADIFTVDATNSVLTINAAAYTGGATNIDLVTFSTNSGAFATSNITVTVGADVESWSIDYDVDSMFLNLAYISYEPGETVLLGEDDNDGNETYVSRVRSGNRQDTGVTWKRCNRMTVANPDFVDASLFTADGTPTNDTSEVLGFLKSTDTDTIFGMYRGSVSGGGTLTYTFNVAGYNHLNMAVDFATTGDLLDTGVKMTTSIDGGPVVTNLVIGKSTADWVQIMEDGRAVTNANSASVTVNGVGAAKLSNEFQTYTPMISGTGSVLTVTLSMSSATGGNYALGMDNLKIYGDVIPEVGDTVAIGKDNFDNAGSYASRTIVGAINTGPGTTWNIVSRDNIEYPGMIDTSVAAGGVVTQDVADVLGFLGTNKTDNIFGMYRALSTRTLTYTFDITNYTNLNLLVDWAASGNAGDKNVSISSVIDGGATNVILDIGKSTADWTEVMDNGTNILRGNSFTMTVNGVATNSLSDEFQTYNPMIDGTGSELTLIFVMDSSIGGYGGIGMDNLVLNGTLTEPPAPAVDYASWAASYGLVGAEADESYDYEPDGLDNLMEYAAGGNPTNVDTVVATFTADDMGTDYFYHVYDQRVDDALTFTLGATDDLVSTPADTNDVFFVGQSAEVDGFRTQTNRTEATSSAKFIQLKVEK